MPKPHHMAGVAGVCLVTLVASGLIGARQQQGGPPQDDPILHDSAESHGVMCGPRDGDRRAGIPDSASAWTTWEIPEYQDRQRFVRKSDGRYGPIACVVAADKIEEISADAFASPRGAFVAVVYVDGEPAGDAAYTNLHLQRGYHCVFLKSEGGTTPGFRQVKFDRTRPTGVNGPVTPTKWTSYIIPSTSKNCLDPLGRPIQGSVVTATDMLPRDIPGVARFVHDTTGKIGIGLRCLDSWCLIGISDADLPRVVHSIPSTSPEKGRRLIFGWYDDQMLAMPRTGATPALFPRLRATVIPDARLEVYKLHTHLTRWREVAVVRFAEKPEGKYQEIWGFKAGVDNTIKIRRVAPWGPRDWQVMVNDVIRPKLKMNFTLHKTTAFLVSTARWAWKDTDEGVWIRCDIGCCEIEPDGTGFGM